MEKVQSLISGCSSLQNVLNRLEKEEVEVEKILDNWPSEELDHLRINNGSSEYYIVSYQEDLYIQPLVTNY